MTHVSNASRCTLGERVFRDLLFEVSRWLFRMWPLQGLLAVVCHLWLQW